jgi:hypothetical protein
VSLYTLTEKLTFIESVLGRGSLSKNSKNFDVRCPYCDPSSAGKRKLSIKTTDDRCHCWVCGFKARSLAPIIRKYGTRSQLSEYVSRFRSDLKAQVTGDEPLERSLALPDDFKILFDCHRRDPDTRDAWMYLSSRSITEEDAWRYRLGLSNDFKWRRRIVFPSFDAAGDLNYFVGRAIDQKRTPKYDSPDVDKNPIVFNEIDVNWKKDVVIVEGPFDVIKCPDNTIAILGSDLDERHEVFNKIIMHDIGVILMLDGDMWNSKTPKLYKKLCEYDVDVKIADVRPWGDPGVMTRSEIVDVLGKSSHMTWRDMFASRLACIRS